MSQICEKIKTFVTTEAVPVSRRVKLATGTTVSLADADEKAIGVSEGAAASGAPVAVRLLGGTTHKVAASAAVTAAASIYGTANGKVDDAGAASDSAVIGVALEAALADGDIIEVILNAVVV